MLKRSSDPYGKHVLSLTQPGQASYAKPVVMRSSSKSPQLILVFQHKGLRSLIGTHLIEQGYRVRGVDTLEQAITATVKSRARPSLLVLDTLNQPLTLDALNSLPLELPVLVCTGPLDRVGPLFSQRPKTLMLHKPFTIRDLVDAVYKICYKVA
jgi:DNA-binding NtrC family response regulator